MTLNLSIPEQINDIKPKISVIGMVALAAMLLIP